MKSNFKRTSLLLTGILVGGKLFAQTADTSKAAADYVKPFSGNNAYNTWSFGINGGVLTTNTIFGSNRNLGFTSPNGNVGYGAFIKYQATPAVGFQVNYLGGKLSGDNGQTIPGDANTPYQSFSTMVHYGLSLNADVTVGNISWHDNKSAIQPYVTSGVGTMNYTPVITYANGTVTDFRTDNNGSINELFVPVGVGLKFEVARGINLDLGYQVNFVYSDNLEGIHYGSANDRFSYAHAGLEFALGGRSKPQLATHNPVSSMRQEYMWENRDTRSTLEGELALQKAQNDQLRNDLNAANANFAKLTMDSDGDGVSDYFDKCPNTPKGTAVDGSGCPLPAPVVKPADTKVYITEEDRKVVNEAVKNLDFEFNKATIRPGSFPSLDRLADLLTTKHFNLKLAGYTDNVGGTAYNLRLSKDRARAVKDYLVGKGVSDSQIQSEGYGKSHAIAPKKGVH
jgi:OOP family OmpA-OmpF porin